MQRDDEPTILASIEAARRELEAAEAHKLTTDRAANSAKSERDRARRLLNDRIITASWNGVPQKLVAERSGRSREAIRLAVLARVDPETIHGTIPGSADDYPPNWRAFGLTSWIEAARKAGLEPKVLPGDLKGDQVAWVLVYDTVYLLEREGPSVWPHYDPFGDPKADCQTSEPGMPNANTSPKEQ